MFKEYITIRKESLNLEVNIPNYSHKKTVKFSEAIYESVKEALAKGRLDELFVYTNVINEKSYIEAIKYILVFGVIPEIKRDKENEIDTAKTVPDIDEIYSEISENPLFEKSHMKSKTKLKETVALMEK